MPSIQTPHSPRLESVRRVLGFLFGDASKKSEQDDRLGGYALTIATALAISLYMSAGLVHAQWSVYADHELRSYLVAYPNLSLADFPSLLSQTEVGYPGELTRFRPINYLFYASEALLWGNNYLLLNVARIVGLCTFSTFLFLGLYRFFPALVACAIGALCLTSVYWKSVWIGFGANEQYLALLGIPFTWTYVRLYWHAGSGNSNMPISWAICLTCAALLAGAKEPMVVVVPAIIILLGLSLHHDRRYDYRLIACATTIAVIGVIVWAILHGLAAHSGADFYGNSVAPSERLAKIFFGVRSYPFPLLLVLGAISLGLGAIAKRTLPAGQPVGATNIAVQFQFWLLALSLCHLVFYDGWPNGNRYEFPGQLFVFISSLIPLFIAGRIIKASRPRLWMPYQAGIFAVAAGIVLLRGFGDFRNDVATYVQSSRNFTTAILTAATRAKSEPNAQIVVEAISPYDLEPIFAVNRFLVSLGVTNPMFLRPHQLTSAAYPKNAFFQGLIDTIEAISERGTINRDTGVGTLPGPFFVDYTPFSSFTTTAPCLSIRIKNAPSDQCVAIATVTY
jgi:hypothetical protein